MEVLTTFNPVTTTLSLIPCWFGVLYASMKVIPCPENLHPKNNKGKIVRDYHKYYNNYPSIFHAVLSVILCTIYAISVGFTHGKDNDPLCNFIIANSLAYFIYDTICAEVLLKPDLAMRIHHLAGMSVLAAVLYIQNSGSECIGALLLAEISNPFNLYRDILKLRGEGDSDKFFQYSLTFASLFIFTRFIIIPIWLPFLYPGATHLLVKVFCGIVWFVSWHWFFIIISLATKAFKQRAKSAEESVWEKMYKLFFKLRTSKAFLASYYATALYLCFGTLYFSHG
mmetsp:Transcript_39370/g.35062  ORF Transcript_39370/g.35062 Transcript_39370/m.35062 type:complete len:283 (+) Transcript_39370:104-952(+)